MITVRSDNSFYPRQHRKKVSLEESSVWIYCDMEGQPSTNPQGESQANLWEERYSRWNLERHRLEDRRLPTANLSKDAVISAFLNVKGTNLDPPQEIRFFQLYDFLRQADDAVLFEIDKYDIERLPCDNDELHFPNDGKENVLLDDRNDPSGRADAKRTWDSCGEEEQGYMDYAPCGKDVYSKKLSITALGCRLKRKVNFHNIKFCLIKIDCEFCALTI